MSGDTWSTGPSLSAFPLQSEAAKLPEGQERKGDDILIYYKEGVAGVCQTLTLLLQIPTGQGPRQQEEAGAVREELEMSSGDSLSWSGRRKQSEVISEMNDNSRAE